jgi:membrane dipeptidase
MTEANVHGEATTHEPPRDDAAWAGALAISREAVALYRRCDVVDLHVDTFIWTRVFGYDLLRKHGRGLFGARFYGQADLPRLVEAGVTGAIWSITTNPLRGSRGRNRVFARNLKRLVSIFESAPQTVAVCRTAQDYANARQTNRHAAFIGVQGGNALDGMPGTPDAALDHIDASWLIKVTLVHLSTSTLGQTSAPLHIGGGDGKLTMRGQDFVRALNERRIFVDLAHINRQGFFDAAEAHDKSQPLLVSHTGVSGVNQHWRNVDDEQLRVVADTGGVVGVIYQSGFLGDPTFAGRAERIVEHLEHIVNVAGEDCAALGSDWDGAIITPRDMPTCSELPKLVQIMLDRKWPEARIRKTLGENFLRALKQLRP